MQFETWTKALAELPVDCVAVGVHDDGELTPEARTLDLRCREKLSRLLKRGDFSGKTGETWLVTDLEGLRAERVLLVGLGPKGASSNEPVTRKAWRRAVIAAISAATRTRVTSLALALPRPAAKVLSDERLGRAVAELAGHTLYRVNDLKSGQEAAPARAHARDRRHVRQGRRRPSRRVSRRAWRWPAAPRSCATSPTCPATSARLPTSARPPRAWRRPTSRSR